MVILFVNRTWRDALLAIYPAHKLWLATHPPSRPEDWGAELYESAAAQKRVRESPEVVARARVYLAPL